MADDATVRIRRAEIAAMLVNPYEKMPSKTDIAERYGVDVRTIYRDMESPEMQLQVQEIVRSYAKGEGIAAAYRVILSAIAGGNGWKKSEQLKAAMWLAESIKLFENGDVSETSKLSRIQDIINGKNGDEPPQ